MTRINVIPVQELSDQHLVAEYHELPRVAKQEIDISHAPSIYCLGKGHVKWARKHLIFTVYRYFKLCEEMKYRGFSINFDGEGYCKLVSGLVSEYIWEDYLPTQKDLEVNRQRLVEKYKMKPQWYRWTKRNKPNYMEEL